MKDNADFVISNKVIEMLTVANEYCLFTEKIKDYKKDDVVLYYSRMMPLLYLKCSLLPDLEIDDSSAHEKFVIEEEWLGIYRDAKELLGKDNYFIWLNDDVNVNDETPKSDSAELLADLYQDLKDFVLLYQKETLAAKENAVYWLKYYFKLQWGEKNIKLLYFAHAYLSKYK